MNSSHTCGVEARGITNSSITCTTPSLICATTEHIGSTLKSSAQRSGSFGVDRRFRHVSAAVEGVIDLALAHIQVLPHDLLLEERAVVTSLQPLVVVRHLFQQMPVFVRLGEYQSVALHRPLQKLPVHPVETLRRPDCETAQPFGLRVPQPSFQPQPRILRRVCQLVQPEPGQVCPPQPLVVVHRPEDHLGPRVTQHQGVLRLVVLMWNPALPQNFEQDALRGVSQHWISGCSQQPRSAWVQIAQPERFLAEGLAFPRAHRAREAFESRCGSVKPFLRRQGAVLYVSVAGSFSVGSTHVTLISLGSSACISSRS